MKSDKNDAKRSFIFVKKILIAGLGNPGEEYIKTRHNVGARVVEVFIGERNFSSDINIYLPNKEFLRGLPVVFMNESGRAIKSLLLKEKIAPKDLLVVHDDVDIIFGRMKLSFGSRSAGHRGAESIIQSLGTKDFWRLRVGIQPAYQDHALRQSLGKHIRADELVLKPFNSAEESELPRIIEAAVGAIEGWMERIENIGAVINE